ncbi:hypothetical protein SEVIR_4G009750v4 [Setaria viridis]
MAVSAASASTAPSSKPTSASTRCGCFTACAGDARRQFQPPVAAPPPPPPPSSPTPPPCQLPSSSPPLPEMQWPAGPSCGVLVGIMVGSIVGGTLTIGGVMWLVHKCRVAGEAVNFVIHALLYSLALIYFTLWCVQRR